MGASNFINKMKVNVWKKLQIFSVCSISIQTWKYKYFGHSGKQNWNFGLIKVGNKILTNLSLLKSILFQQDFLQYYFINSLLKLCIFSKSTKTIYFINKILVKISHIQSSLITTNCVISGYVKNVCSFYVTFHFPLRIYHLFISMLSIPYFLSLLFLS